MNQRLLSLLFFGLCLTLPLPASAADSDMKLKEGAWNITLQLDPPQDGALPIVQMLCLTRKEPVPVPAQRGGCRIITKEILGDTVFWVAECRENGIVTRSVGNATYDAVRVEGAVQTMTSASGKATEMRTYKLAGRRQGSCK